MSEQKKSPPGLSDFIENKLDSEIKQGLLNFIEYCKSQKMSIRLSSGYLWGVFFKGKRVATIEITIEGMCRGQYMHKDNSWIIGLCYIDVASPDFETFAANENISEIIWENVGYCKKCLKTCVGAQPPGVSKRIAGKTFSNVSVCGYVKFKNPGGEALDCLKRLMEFRKKDIISEKTLRAD